MNILWLDVSNETLRRVQHDFTFSGENLNLHLNFFISTCGLRPSELLNNSYAPSCFGLFTFQHLSSALSGLSTVLRTEPTKASELPSLPLNGLLSFKEHQVYELYLHGRLEDWATLQVMHKKKTQLLNVLIKKFLMA